jgi:enterochelin esterase-like enzyme
MKIELKRYPQLVKPGLLPRDVWVWTPLQYASQPEAPFPVIYMHDGQNLFIPEKSYTHVTWGVLEVMTRLSRWGFIQPAIVVGIDNTPKRMGITSPPAPLRHQKVGRTSTNCTSSLLRNWKSLSLWLAPT